MLLRSTSNPAFESLVPVLRQPEYLSEAFENEAKVARESPRSLSFSRPNLACGSFRSSGVQHLSRTEVFSGDETDRDVAQELALVRSIEKVQSENDLLSHSVGSTSSVTVAASSLLSSRGLTSTLGVNGKPMKSWSSRCYSRTQSSVISFPSVSFGALGLDKHDFVPKIEVETRIESVAPADEKGSERREVFDRIGAAEDDLKQYSGSGVEDDKNQILQHSASGIVLDVRGCEAHMKQKLECSVQSRSSVTDEWALDQEERAAFSGRVEETRTRQSSPAGSKSGSVVCDSRRCRPNSRVDEQHLILACGGGNSRGGGGRPSGVCTGGSGPGFNSESTDLYYRELLEEDPCHPLLLRNYAQYLAEVKRDYAKAEEYCQRAILANPSDGEILAQYGKLIWDRQRDYERATSYFERAVKAAPDNSYVMAAFACFLWNVEEDGQVEEEAGSSFPCLPSLVAAS